MPGLIEKLTLPPTKEYAALADFTPEQSITVRPVQPRPFAWGKPLPPLPPFVLSPLEQRALEAMGLLDVFAEIAGRMHGYDHFVAGEQVDAESFDEVAPEGRTFLDLIADAGCDTAFLRKRRQ